MSIFSRFFGKVSDDDSKGQLVAKPNDGSTIGFDVLFAETPKFDNDQLRRHLRGFHKSMHDARCEIDAKLAAEGKFVGLIGWKNHVLQLIGFDVPMPAEAAEACIAPAHYPQQLKERARAHSSHVLLNYAGSEPDILERYVAMAAVVGVLSKLGAIVVLNESARTSFPAAALSGEDVESDIFDLLRTLPLPILYCGFVKHEVQGYDGVWMRTYGAHLFGLPDFAALAKGHHEGERYFGMFDNIFRYLRQSGSVLAPGHTAQVGEAEHARFRSPREDESFLEGNGQMLVAEIISADEINRPL
jgi:hypothetical protein